MSQNKSSLRTDYQKIVKNLSSSQKEAASLLICEKLLKLSVLAHAPTVALFSARTSEPNLTFLFERLKGKKIGFPQVDLKTNTLNFFSTENLGDLKVGAFNILEPFTGELLKFSTRDVILVPGLAFDKQGSRLGSGKGFYDKFLQTVAPVIRVGVCFDAQIHSTPLPVEPHDMKMNFLVTESQTLGPF